MRSFKKLKSNLDSGFTLIELLVVIIIIGILAGIAVIGITGAQNAAVSKACTANAVQIAKGLRGYFAATGKFPRADTVLSGLIATPDGNDSTGTTTVFSFDDLKKLSLESPATTAGTNRGKFLEKLPEEANPAASTKYTLYATPDADNGIKVHSVKKTATSTIADASFTGCPDVTG